jgi:hypothetical protein
LPHDANDDPLTTPALRLSDCPVSAPLGIAVPLPALVAERFPDAIGCPGPLAQVVLLKRAHATGAEPTPVALMLTFPSVNVVDAEAPDAPVVCTKYVAAKDAGSWNCKLKLPALSAETSVVYDHGWLLSSLTTTCTTSFALQFAPVNVTVAPGL